MVLLVTYRKRPRFENKVEDTDTNTKLILILFLVPGQQRHVKERVRHHLTPEINVSCQTVSHLLRASKKIGLALVG
jgi:hypothetical protein